MTTYQLTHDSYVIKDGDTKVPILDSVEFGTHPETLLYREWLAAGGVPLPADPMTPEMALAQIAAIEAASESPQRIVREGLILMVEAQAKAQNVPLDYVRLKNKGYRLLKECEEQIEALRKFIV